MTQHFQQESTNTIFFITVLSISFLVIIIPVYETFLANNQTLLDITNFLTENKIMFLSLISGAIVGFSLGFIGGGGSILAVPLLLYVVGVEDPHAAIGTSALAVSINAAINLLFQTRQKNIKFMKGLRFGMVGILGTFIGSQLGLLTSPNNLILFFGLLMLFIATNMLIRTPSRTSYASSQGIKCRSIIRSFTRSRYFNLFPSRRLELKGLLVGLAAGYFGIGGGFLIVPFLVSSGLDISSAIGTSLIPVSMFGATTALGYSLQNHINILISLLFVIGGIGGGFLGTTMLSRIRKNVITKIFAILIAVVGIYIIIKFLSS